MKKQMSLSSMFVKPEKPNGFSGKPVKTEKYMPARQTERSNRLTHDPDEGIDSYGLGRDNTSKWNQGSSKFMRADTAASRYTNGFVPNRVAGAAEPDENRGDLPSMDPKYDEDINLSASQKYVLDLIMQRKSVFFTGAAGTGKSFILRVLSDVMDKLGKSDKIAFTASTGVAACNIRGLTVHSWSGLAIMKPGDTIADVIGTSLRSGPAKARWKNTDILVIDEISMISDETLELLDAIGKRQRNDTRPFGGIQLVLCGDFFQLPPVAKGDKVKYCFEAPSWKQLFETNRTDGIIVLDVVFRQKEDTKFLNMLNEMRKGEVSERTKYELNKKWAESKEKLRIARTKEVDLEEVVPTKLFSTNKDVDSFNQCELRRLAEKSAESEVHKFLAFDSGQEPYLKQLIQGTKAPQELELRVGAQVMLLKNLSVEDGLVNGSRGRVIRFEPSRGRSAKFRFLPVVKFLVTLGSETTTETVVLKEEDFSTKVGNEEKAVRIQLPLMLAWALSIHKSQGMTIPLLEVSFNRIFECGQAYVALSRATTLEGLTLVDFNTHCIRANPAVVKFYESRSGKTVGGSGSSGGTSKMVTTSVTAIAETFVGGALPPAPVIDDGWMESTRDQRAAAAEMRAQTDAAIRQSVVVKDESSTVNPYSVSRAEIKRQETARAEANPFRAYEYDEWLEKKLPVNISTSLPLKSEQSTELSSVGLKREWSLNSDSSGDVPDYIPSKRVSVPSFNYANTPETAMNLLSESTSTESSPSVYDLSEDLSNHDHDHGSTEVVAPVVEEHYFTRPKLPSFSAGMQRSNSAGNVKSSGAGGSSSSGGGGVAYPSSSVKPSAVYSQPPTQSVSQTLPPRPSSASKAGITLGSFIEPFRKKQSYMPTTSASSASSTPPVKSSNYVTPADGSGVKVYAATSNSGGFTGGFNPYAPTKNVIKIKETNGNNYPSSNSASSNRGSSSGPAASEVKMNSLTDEQKQRIEANKQAAMKKLAESKLRREEEMQKVRSTFIV